MISFPPVQRVLFLSPHGIGSALGFLLGARLLLAEVRRRGGLSEDVVIRALTWAAVGAIVGARLDYVISHPREWESVGEALALWRGGLALFGGFIGGVAFALPVLVRNRVHLPRFLDAAAPGFALGVVIGRIGDIVIWDHLGDVATGWAKPFGFLVKPGYDLAPGFGPSPAVPLPAGNSCEAAVEVKQFFAGCAYHQPALYDLLGALALLSLLLWIRQRGRARAGVAFLVWGVWYGTQRLVIDVTRSIDERPLLGLTGTQLLSVVLVTVSLALLALVGVRRRGLGEQPGDPPSRQGSLVRDGGPAAPEAGDDGQSSDGSPPSDASSTPSANPLA